MERTKFWHRFKSWPLWLALSALVVFVAEQFGLHIDATVDDLLKVLLPVLIAFGIVNDPMDVEHF